MADKQINILALFKQDMGIKNNAKDAYFKTLIKASEKELERKGIKLDKSSVDDAMLISDFAAWNYRKRQEDVPLSANLLNRIRNRIMRRRAKGG
ncbi:MAG: hypothetical protein K1W13_02850 [Lachnospiraceae bacterium]